MKLMSQIMSPKNSDIRNRILFTLAALFIFKLGTTIKVPGALDSTSSLGFLDLLNIMGGDALKQSSIFATGVFPYINASIIISLLIQFDIIPKLKELSEQGNTGRQGINQITRYVGIGISFIMGYFYSFMILGSGKTAMEYLTVSVILTAGTSFLLWLGDQITLKGIGNGLSMIIMAGIISTMPGMFIEAFRSLVNFDTTQTIFMGAIWFVLFVSAYLAVLVGIVFINESERRLPIQYSNSTSASYGAKQTYMPFKLNSAGVMPVIYASALMSLPSVLAKFINNANFTIFVQKYLNYSSAVGLMIYVVAILFFTYFQTFSQLKPKDLADRLKKEGGYIPGIRPGVETVKYVKKVLVRLTSLGAVFLLVIVLLPIVLSSYTSLPTTVTIGGTGLLIGVGVALETYKQIESRLMARNYKGGRK